MIVRLTATDAFIFFKVLDDRVRQVGKELVLITEDFVTLFFGQISEDVDNLLDVLMTNVLLHPRIRFFLLGISSFFLTSSSRNLVVLQPLHEANDRRKVFVELDHHRIASKVLSGLRSLGKLLRIELQLLDIVHITNVPIHFVRSLAMLTMEVLLSDKFFESLVDEDVQFILDFFKSCRDNFTVTQSILDLRNDFLKLLHATITGSFSKLDQFFSIKLRSFSTFLQQFLNFHRSISYPL